MSSLRVQKYFSDLGVASRRQTEAWITQGYVFLNGEKLLEPGTRFDPDHDEVKVSSKVLSVQKYYYFVYNKPIGIVTVNAQKGEKEIRDLIRVPRGVVTVGRLDKDSSGLIMLTNDGVVARRLMEPSFEHEKEYLVTFARPITEEAIRKLESGLFLGGKRLKPVVVKRLAKSRITMTLKEGKNRQIRKMCRQVGFPVSVLKRIRLLSFQLGRMEYGELRELSPKAVKQLYQEIGLSDRNEIINKLVLKE